MDISDDDLIMILDVVDEMADCVGTSSEELLTHAKLYPNRAMLLASIHKEVAIKFGKDIGLMKNWYRTENENTNGVPAMQIKTEQEIGKVLSHLLGLI